MAGRFDGKQALVLGVANRRSIAWAIAHRLAEEGAQIAFMHPVKSRRAIARAFHDLTWAKAAC